MPAAASVLVAHGTEEERTRLGAALYEAGYEVIEASSGVEALRSTAGVNPKLVLAHADLPGVPAAEVVTRLQATGLRLPPFLIVFDDPSQLPAEPLEGDVHFVSAEGLELDGLVQRARLLMLAGAVDGEFGDSLDTMYGDLTRTSFGELLQTLHRHVISGRLAFASDGEACIWLREGLVVDAVRGPVRGRKAFNRLAALPTGSFSLSLEESEVERRIELDPDTLVMEAVEERVAFEEALSRLPSLDARPTVQLTDAFFSQEFSAAERQVMTVAQQVTTLGELVDAVDAVDQEVAEAVERLHGMGLLALDEPAGRIHVVTDSTADILPSDARRAGVTVVPVSIVFGTEVFMDGVDLEPEEFHRRLREARELPVTHPATRGEFMETYRRLTVSGDVLGILCSSKLSQSFDNARAAAEEGVEDLRQARRQARVSADPVVHTVDSRQSSGALGMLVLFASRMIRRGLSLQEAAAQLERMARRLRTVLMVPSLDYLQRSGNVAAGGARRGGRHTRWLLRLDEGELKVVAQAEGIAEGARKLLDLVCEGADPKRPTFAVLVHASAPAQAAELRPRLTQRLPVRELVEREMGPAVTCHTGPGTLGISVFQPTDDELELVNSPSSTTAN